jgi:heparin binding hemagglutinin HbhA
MTLATTIDKTRKDIEKALGDKSPLLVLAGVSDLAAERVRAARAEVSARAANFDPKALRDQAQATIASLPVIAQELPAKAQEAAEDAVTIVVSSALTAYGDLSERGMTLVNRVRGQQSTSELKEQAATTASKAKAVKTTAKKSAASTTRSAKATTTTAKKSAARTKTSAKSAATSAKKTTKAAKKAADDTASKAGN